MRGGARGRAFPPFARGSRSAAPGPGRDGRLHAPRSAAPGLFGAGGDTGGTSPAPRHCYVPHQHPPAGSRGSAPTPAPQPRRARTPLSRLVTGAAGQPPSSRPASPPSDWASRSERSTNPGSRCSLRQRQQLRQLGSTPPAPRACSAAAAPWRQASRGTHHSPSSPQKRGHLSEKRAEKAAGEATGSR